MKTTSFFIENSKEPFHSEVVLEATDLRVGNWVLWDLDGIRFVVSDIQTFDKTKATINGLPELLEKCGFRKDGEDFTLDASNFVFDYGYNNPGYVLYIWENRTDMDVQAIALDHKHYLHELQNLYFALEHEELEVHL